ncbi:MAG: hypothetical protein QG623_361 [Patescibacteria group bacterium]|nr:hypothetical protein [Patescibacteria group bacterium]
MPLETLEAEFKEIVETVVQPVLEGPGRPIYLTPGLLAQNSTNITTHRVGYMLFKDKEPEGVGGIDGLDFNPSHALQLITVEPSPRTISGQAMFGLRRSGGFSRSLLDNHTHGSTTRELNPEEVEALVAFSRSPMLCMGELAVILQVTEDEARVFAEARSSHREDMVGLREELRAIEEAERG